MGKGGSAHNTRQRIWAARSALASGEGHGNPIPRIGCPPEEMLKVTRLENGSGMLSPVVFVVGALVDSIPDLLST
jgi:hypothetical protein